MPTNQDIVKTILQQLGGAKFFAMTGARVTITSMDGREMQLSVPMRRVHAIRIRLGADDTYSVRGYRIGRGRKVTVTGEAEGVQAAQLATTFERLTGLRTSL